MKIYQNYSLKHHNTFGIDEVAEWFVTVENEEELLNVLADERFRDMPRLMLGGGSNMLLTGPVKGLVIHVGLKGKKELKEKGEEVIEESSNCVPLEKGECKGGSLKDKPSVSPLLRETNRIMVQAAAGENWHEFVMWTLEQGWGGLENLALIPGNTGTAPVQNIGAYGVEVKDRIVSLDAIEVETGEGRTFTNAECQFGYRDSIFKRDLKGKYIITAVRFRLTTKNHELNTGYGAIEDELGQVAGESDSVGQGELRNKKEEIREESSTSVPLEKGECKGGCLKSKPSVSPLLRETKDKLAPIDIAQAVIRIRQRKLPDPAEIGNSGSFFKNPVVAEEKFQALRAQWPEIPGYVVGDGFGGGKEKKEKGKGSGFTNQQIMKKSQAVPGADEFSFKGGDSRGKEFPLRRKIPAAYLIDKCGWKGFRRGDAGVHERQPLVLVNFDQVTGREIYDLSEEIKQSVLDKFGIELEREVNVIGFRSISGVISN